jgi:hypothetical protein
MGNRKRDYCCDESGGSSDVDVVGYPSPKKMRYDEIESNIIRPQIIDIHTPYNVQINQSLTCDSETMDIFRQEHSNAEVCLYDAIQYVKEVEKSMNDAGEAAEIALRLGRSAIRAVEDAERLVVQKAHSLTLARETLTQAQIIVEQTRENLLKVEEDRKDTEKRKAQIKSNKIKRTEEERNKIRKESQIIFSRSHGLYIKKEKMQKNDEIFRNRKTIDCGQAENKTQDDIEQSKLEFINIRGIDIEQVRSTVKKGQSEETQIQSEETQIQYEETQIQSEETQIQSEETHQCVGKHSILKKKAIPLQIRTLPLDDLHKRPFNALQSPTCNMHSPLKLSRSISSCNNTASSFCDNNFTTISNHLGTYNTEIQDDLHKVHRNNYGRVIPKCVHGYPVEIPDLPKTKYYNDPVEEPNGNVALRGICQDRSRENSNSLLTSKPHTPSHHSLSDDVLIHRSESNIFPQQLDLSTLLNLGEEVFQYSQMILKKLQRSFLNKTTSKPEIRLVRESVPVDISNEEAPHDSFGAKSYLNIIPSMESFRSNRDGYKSSFVGGHIYITFPGDVTHYFGETMRNGSKLIQYKYLKILIRIMKIKSLDDLRELKGHKSVSL